MKHGHVNNRFKETAGIAWPLFCQHVFDAAIEAVLPYKCLPPHLPDIEEYTAVKVLAFGKEAAQMAAIVEEHWAHEKLSGLIICPYERSPKSSIFNVIEAAHPIPDDNSLHAAECALNIAAAMRSDELLLVLVSGGGSALMAKPVQGFSLRQKQMIVKQLLYAGASINETNLIRRALSAVKGGKLLSAAAKAKQVITLAVSDVVGDDPATIASGPTVPCETIENEQIEALFQKYNVSTPISLSGITSKGQALVPRHSYSVIASGAQALVAIEHYLLRLGFQVFNMGHHVEGEARFVAKEHATQILETCIQGASRMPAAFISGGELTVTVIGGGIGGPNQEYALALMQELPAGAFYAFSADTDGLDGQGAAAGAMFGPQIYDAAELHKLDASKYINDNNSFNFFNKLGCIFKPKHNVMNVNDIRVVCWIPEPAKHADHQN